MKVVVLEGDQDSGLVKDELSFGAAAADLLLGSACVGCARPGPALCPRCQEPLEQLPRRVRPSPTPPGLPDVWAVAAYEGPVRAALIAHKEEARLSLAKPLGRALALGVMGLLSRADEVDRVLLAPVPSRRAVVRERGHDPLGRLTAVCRRTLRGSGIDAGTCRLLRQVAPLADQAGLTAGQRRANLDRAFGVRGRRPTGRFTIVVVDDIVTTGATAAEAVRALGAAGLDTAGVAVVAATRRRGVPI